jgi:hypothetical protein
MKTAGVNTNRHHLQSPAVAGVALDVQGRWLLELFHHTNIGRFLLRPLDRGQRDTSRLPITPGASPAPTGNQREQHIKPERNKEKV